MKPLWENVQQEAPEELVGAERHRGIPGRPGAAIVLIAEGHAAFVERDEATVRDGDAMGVAGEIGEDGLRSGERPLGVDHPLAAAQRRKEGVERAVLGEWGEGAEEGEAASLVQGCEAVEEEPAEETRQNAHR
jgi:hypothetical protein